MREAILQLLQQRMDKCTTEQLWAVAMVTGLDAFALHSSAAVAGLIPIVFVITCGAAAFVGIWYVISRHRHYYACRDAMAVLLRDEEDAPSFLKVAPRASNLGTWLGSGFYISWMLAGFAAVLWALI